MLGALVLRCGDLAEKAEGEFTEEDEEATVALAEQAANTISFERRFQGKAAVD
jgi:hypothetical protein